MDLVVYDDDEKRYVPWAVALSAALLVALLTAVLTFVLARQASGDDAEPPVSGLSSGEPATRPTDEPSAAASSPAAASAAPACEAALQRADALLERSGAVDEALAQHTDIMDELLAERITAEQALDQALPVLTSGATERQRLEEAVAAYRDAREECRS